jgi:carboxymethylenebutenolidase
MLKRDIKIPSSEDARFDCYVVTPETELKVPAVVLASSVRGVDSDLRNIADEFAAQGYICAAPDLFWRTVPGPLERDDPRLALRGQPRLKRIEAGEQDLIDLLTMLRTLPLFNGRAALVGFCYGGPYAILGPKRLGYRAGISCHGSHMLDFINELEGVVQPVCLMWGDRDHLALADVRNAYRTASARIETVAVHVFADVQHGYMMRSSSEAFDPGAYDFSMARALEILNSLRSVE